MSWRRNIVAGLSAAALTVAMAPSFAAALPADGSIEVTGLATGDTVAKYYQVVKLNATTGNWEMAGTFGDPALTVANITDGIDAEEAGIIAAALQSGAGTAMTVASGKATATVDPGTYLVIVTPNDNNTVYAHS